MSTLAKKHRSATEKTLILALMNADYWVTVADETEDETDVRYAMVNILMVEEIRRTLVERGVVSAEKYPSLASRSDA